MPNTIKLKKYLDVIIERAAVAAITPGMLIELTSADKVQKHSTAEGNAIPMFALENELEGEAIADAYAADDQVQCWVAQRGEEVYAWLADGETVVIGDKLASDGTGYLRKHDISSGGAEFPLGIVAIALEAKDLSGSSAAESSGLQGAQRLKVMVV